MPAVPSIQFTQEQARIIVGLTAERLRHWREQVAYLSAKGGKASRFTLADLTGLSVMRELVEQFDVGINKLAPGLNELFRVLAETRIQALEDSIAIVGPRTGLLRTAAELGTLRPAEACLMVPCRPLLTQMHGQVFPAISESQGPLPFPPVAVKAAS